MQSKIHIITSIVISAVLLGFVVVKCVEWWMPATPKGWILWGVLTLVGLVAVGRIANLAKALGHNDEE